MTILGAPSQSILLAPADGHSPRTMASRPRTLYEGLVKRQAEAERLDCIVTAAGPEWRAPGGRQGPGARTHPVSPAVAAAAAGGGPADRCSRACA